MNLQSLKAQVIAVQKKIRQSQVILQAINIKRRTYEGQPFSARDSLACF
jgi:hypothetical protein